MEWRITAARSKGEMTPSDFDVCFSNRPSAVRRFQTIRRGSVDHQIDYSTCAICLFSTVHRCTSIEFRNRPDTGKVCTIRRASGSAVR